MDKLTIGLARKIHEMGMQIEEKCYLGKRRELVSKCMEHYGLTELQALNISNGYHLQDYVIIQNQKYNEWKKGKKDG